MFCVDCGWKGGELAKCLLSLSGCESHSDHMSRLPVISGWAVLFAGYYGSLHQLQLASHNLAAIWQKM